jgi:hypothetical protein
VGKIVFRDLLGIEDGFTSWRFFNEGGLNKRNEFKAKKIRINKNSGYFNIRSFKNVR